MSPERYGSLLAAIDDLMLTVDTHGIVTFANQSALRYANGVDLFGAHVDRVFGPEFMLRILIGKEAAGSERGTSFRFDVTGSTDEATTIDVRVASIREHDTVVGYTILARDVTEISRTRDRMRYLSEVLIAVRETHQRMTYATDVISLLTGVCACLLIPSGTTNVAIVYTAGPEPEFVSLGAVSSDELRRINHKALPPCVRKVTGPEAAIVEVHYERAAHCSSCALAPLHTGQGSVTVAIEHNGRVYGALVVTRAMQHLQDQDVHQVLYELSRDIGLSLETIALRKRERETEAKIRRSEERYRTLFYNSADAFFLLSDDGRVIDMNQAGAHMLGYTTTDELIGIEASRLWHRPEDRDHIVQQLDRGGAIRNHEVVFRTKDDRVIYGSESATRFFDAERAEYVYQVSVQDISQRIENERLLTQRTLDLTKANQKVTAAQAELVKKEKLASIGHLSAGIAHEINNPLGFVRSNFSALKRYVNAMKAFFVAYHRDGSRLAATPDPEVKALYDHLHETWATNKIAAILDDVDDLFAETADGVERITTIVSNLKEFSRAGENQVTDIYDINQGVESTLVIARNTYKYVAEVHRDLQHVPTITCNANEINQVLLNIVVNAAQAIEAAKTPNGAITIGTRSDGCFIRCSISDNGPGIPAAVRESVFEPFFTTKSAGKGTGLGLSISYDIVVNRHGGALEMESEDGAGTTFTIVLPVDRTEDE